MSAGFSILKIAIIVLLYNLMGTPCHAKSLPAIGKIPEPLISLESSKNTIVLVEKASQQLFLYQYDGEYREILRMKCSTGKVRGNKKESGDQKTPEGIYFCTREFTKKDLSPIYGTRAFPIDYPNPVDKIEGKNGSAIWLHGTNKPLKKRDSNGCIALNNDDINRLASYVSLYRTPVILVDQLQYKRPEENRDLKKSVVEFLNKWCRSFNAPSVSEYLKFYDDRAGLDDSFWKEWAPIRDRLQSAMGQISVGIQNLSVYRHEGLLVALFEQVAQTRGLVSSAGSRKLYIKQTKDRYKIIGDEFMTGADGGGGQSSSHPLIVASMGLKKDFTVWKEVRGMVDGWLAAWTSKNINRYGRYYSKDFQAMNMDLTGWLKYKNGLNQQYGYINVGVDNLSISVNGNKSRVTFLQTYKSSGLSDVGFKELQLVREGGEWKIFREIWTEK